MNQAPKTAAQYEQQFEHMRQDNRVNDKVLQIPGYQVHNKSKSYLMRIQGIKGVKMPSSVKMHDEKDLTAELHMSFFYRDMKSEPKQMFFFGRTARSTKTKLKQDKGSNTYSTDEKDVEFLYFHSSLGKTLQEASNRAAKGAGTTRQTEVYLVFELVVTAVDSVKSGEAQVFSGGYGTCKIFELGNSRKLETVNLAKGSPRDLLALVQGSRSASDAYLSLTLTEDYSRFDELQKLIPGECIITREAVVPGLAGESFPAPDKDPKYDTDAKHRTLLRLATPITLFIHKIEVVGSTKVEDFLCRTLAKMFCDKKASGHGMRQDPDDINVQVTERKINVMVHNSWKQVCGETRSSTLQRPDEHGVFAADALIQIKEYFAHPLCALVFELQFNAKIQGHEEKQVCLGFGISLPELNSAGSLVARDVQLKLTKGPGETLSRTLLFSESTAEENLLDFALRAYVTTSADATKEVEAAKLQRARSIKTWEREGLRPGPSPRRPQSDNPYRAWMRPEEKLPQVGTREYDEMIRQGRIPDPQASHHGGLGAGHQGGSLPPPGGKLPEVKVNYHGRVCRGEWHDPMIVTKGRNGENMLPPGHPFNHDDPHGLKMPYPGQAPGWQYPQQPGRPNIGGRDGYVGSPLHGGSPARGAYQPPWSPTNSQTPMPMHPGASHDPEVLAAQGYAGYEAMNNKDVANMMRLLETQKTQMSQEQAEMKAFMQKFMDKMIDLQEDDRRKPGPGQYSDPKVRPNEEMRQISNVLCNLLGMIGSQKGDERIIGLSEELKQQVQSRRFDNLFNDNVPYAGFEKINLLRVSDMSTKDQANLIKQGLGDLLHHPSAQILSSGIIKEKLDMKMEADDLKASIIKCKFLAFKTPIGRLGDVPKRFFFKMRFFTFPPIQTDALRLKVDSETSGNFVMLQPGTPYLLEKQLSAIAMGQGANTDNPHLEVSFRIDAAESKIINEHIKLANYLKERFLTIDIFDVKTKFFYGSCKIPLYEILRQGQQQVVRPKECEIFNPENSQYKGFLQIVLSNTGEAPAISEAPAAKQKAGRQPGQGAHNSKKITSKPMDLVSMQQASMIGGMSATTGPGPTASLHNTYKSNDHNQTMLQQLSQTQFEASMADPNLRKKLRVDRIRKLTAGTAGGHGQSSIINDPKQPDWAKHNQIQQIDMIRQAKKHLIVKEVMGNYLSDSQQVTVIPGEYSFLEVPLENNTDARQSYSVTILDPDQDLLEESEVKMVSSQAEFQHWIDMKKCEQQPTHCLTDKDTVLLQPTEKINLLFKFLTTREISTNAGQAASCDFIKQRSIKISFTCNNIISKQIECNVIPLHPPIDHVFRYYEPEHSYFKVKIPPFLQFPQEQLYLGVSKATAQVTMHPNTQAIEVSSRTNEALNVIEMTVYVWSGAYRSNLLATVKVEVTPLACIYTQTRAGVQNSMTLNLPVQNARQIEIHSSKPKNVYLPERSVMNKFNVIPNSINYIQVQTKTYSEQEERVVVNAIESDAHDRSRLVYSWLLIMASQAPTATKNVDMLSDVRTQTTGKIKFDNPSRESLLFDIASSNDQVLCPTENLMKINGRSSAYIEFMVYPIGQVGTMPVYLYISDANQRVMECIKVNIRFLSH